MADIWLANRASGTDWRLMMGDTMKRHFVKIHTGPCDVDRIANQIESAGWPVQTRGTESIYLWLDDDPHGWGVMPELHKIECALGYALTGELLPAVVVKSVDLRSVTEQIGIA